MLQALQSPNNREDGGDVARVLFVIGKTQIAPDDVFDEAQRFLLYKLQGHVIEDLCDGEESLVCLANVIQAGIVQKDLLDDENGHLDAVERIRLRCRLECTVRDNSFPDSMI